MGLVRLCGIGLGLIAGISAAAAAADRPSLRETSQPEQTTQVVIEMKAQGRFLPAVSSEAVKTEGGQGRSLRVESRLEFIEKVVAVDASGRPRRAMRRVSQAASAINGDVRPIASQLRPAVSLLVTEWRPSQGQVVSWSVGGPLTRSELDLIQGPGDPLSLASLLPDKAVAEGERWTVTAEAAKSLSSYDALAQNRLEAKLVSFDDRSARIKLGGEVRGAVLGGEGVMTIAGWFTFDRKEARIDHLEVTRQETRKPGPVEAGLDVKSTITIDRKKIETPAELTDRVLGALSLDADPQRELLLLAQPDGKYTMTHDRDWHLFWDDTRQMVLKRLDHGEVVAQCNLAMGPNAGKGKHQDVEKFREDIRKALGKRFGRVVGSGEIEGAPGGGFRYKCAVQGQEGDVGLIWYYYLVASPAGDQLLVTYTMTDAQAKAFADQDARMIGSLEWQAAPNPAKSD